MATPKSATGMTPFVCRACRHTLFARPRRRFTTTPPHRAEDSTLSEMSKLLSNARTTQTQPRPSRFTTRDSRPSRQANSDMFASITAALDGPTDYSSILSPEFHDNEGPRQIEEPHRLHVYAHKHNTHITFVQPSKPLSQTPHLMTPGMKTSVSDQNKTISVLLSLSTGNLGFKKAGRGSYDAAFQLAAFVLKQIQEKGMWRDVKNLEVVLRGFGAGREAVSKALLGSEGRLIRGKIVSVADSTRLKQGGPRAKKPRRLG